jgi:hypothetical protein
MKRWHITGFSTENFDEIWPMADEILAKGYEPYGSSLATSDGGVRGFTKRYFMTFRMLVEVPDEVSK